MDRKKFIGSSEIAGVMGVSRWSTPFKIWALKTGKLEQSEQSEYMEWGTRLESVVADKFSEKNDVKLMAYKQRFTHDKYKYLSCELDRIITGTDEIVEVKTAGAFMYKEWSDPEDIPAEYVMQVIFALGLSGRKVGHFAVLVGGNKYLEKHIEFDQELYDTMIEKAVDFWDNYVLKDVAPMVVAADSDILKDIYPDHDDVLMDMTKDQDMNNDIAYLQQLKGEIGTAIEEKKGIEAKVKKAINENLGLKTGDYRVTWKKQSRKESVVKASETRVLRIKKTEDKEDEQSNRKN